MFPKPEVAARLSKFVRVRLMVDDPAPGARSKEWYRLLKDRFHTAAIPLYAVFDAEGRALGSITYPGGGADAFVPRMGAFLDEMLAKVPPR